MNQIEIKYYGYPGYALALLIIASPWLFNIAEGGPETWIPVLFGFTMILYHSAKDDKLRNLLQIPIRRQLLNQIMEGILITLSTWLFGFANYLLTPHTLLSLLKQEWNDFFVRS